MIIKDWVFHVAGRYFLTKRKEKGHTASLLAVGGIAIGVMTLLGVIAVMNGFQQGFITNINEVRSYHIRIESGDIPDDSLRRDILSIDGVQSVTAFADIQTIIQGFFAEQNGAAVRAVETSVMEEDHGFAAKVKMNSGSFDLSGDRNIILGSDLARAAGVRTGDRVNLLSLAGKGYEKLSPVNLEFTVTGIFTTGYYEINRNMAFISMIDAPLFLSEKEIVLGVKLRDHYKDREILKKLEKIPGLEGVYMESWREYNRSFFSALLMEKVMMMVLISLIFIVVAVNIYHSMKRSVVERIDEIAVMKAVGASAFSIQLIFILEGAFIGLMGSAAGALLGYGVTTHINGIFDFVEFLVNGTVLIFAGLTGSAGPADSFGIYSGSDYYLQSISVVIMKGDVIYILAAAFLSVLAAAWFASRGVSSVKPAEVLRYE